MLTAHWTREKHKAARFSYNGIPLVHEALDHIENLEELLREAHTLALDREVPPNAWLDKVYRCLFALKKTGREG